MRNAFTHKPFAERLNVKHTYMLTGWFCPCSFSSLKTNVWHVNITEQVIFALQGSLTTLIYKKKKNSQLN